MNIPYLIYDVSAGNVIGFGSASQYEELGQGKIECSDEEAQNWSSYKVVNGVVTALSDAELAASQATENLNSLQNSARLALDQSDITVMRCYEAGQAVPDVWKQYRAALRAIVSATSSDDLPTLPTKPAYPSA
ncbi:hypothetical protein [Paraburkholderia tropica]|uniref:hypothetical protein n=1 Tax=Paraburkholderia tropica TaxID=92647 RepID=UPI002AB5F253|nr:hypothetical protein [Paraburkholderia tropica]